VLNAPQADKRETVIARRFAPKQSRNGGDCFASLAMAPECQDIANLGSHAPAIPGAMPALCVSLSFSWKGPDNQTGDDPHFVPRFSSPGENEVEMTSSLRFGVIGNIPFLPKLFRVDADPLSEHALAKVELPSFVTIVDSKTKF